jgi:TRAP-type C4-dicarboxylate transport system permease small subunit
MKNKLSAIDSVTRGMMVLTAFCAFAMAIFILVEISARILGLRFYGTAEYIRNTLIIIVFLQLPFAVRWKSMLAVDIFINYTPRIVKKSTAILGCLLGILFFGAVIVGAWEPAVISWVENEYEGEGIVDVAAWPAKFSIVIGCGFSVFYYFVRLFDIIFNDVADVSAGETAL